MPTKYMVIVAILSSIATASSNQLANLCQKALQNNPRIKSYGHRTLAGHSFYDQSIDRYKPNVNISGQYGNQNYKYEYPDRDDKYHGTNYNYNLSLRQPIYRAQLIEAISDAKAKETLSILQEDDEKAKLVTQVVQNAIDLARQKKIISILKKKVTLLKAAYENIDQKFIVQMASNVEKYQALAKLQQSKSDLIKAQQIYDSNLYNLRLLTKYDDVEKYVDSINFNIEALRGAYTKSKIRSIQESIHNNTRIKLDDQSVRIAKIQIELRNSERSPQIDATLSYGDAGGSIDTITRKDETRAMISLNFPLFQGGLVDDRVKEARYLYYAAREDAENSRLNIKISLEKTLQNIKGGLASIQAELSAVDASKKYFEGATKSYQSGVSSLTDAYIAEADYRDAQLRVVNTEADILSSLAEVYYYNGHTDYKSIKRLQDKYLR